MKHDQSYQKQQCIWRKNFAAILELSKVFELGETWTTKAGSKILPQAFILVEKGNQDMQDKVLA